MKDNELLPLERELKRLSEEDVHKFPASKNYFHSYITLKQYLTDHVYKYIGAATSLDGGLYTDHSIDHFQQVIKYAGKLLELDDKSGSESERKEFLLYPYEVYLLLSAILLHDAGNSFGREDHERRPFTILVDAGNAVCSNTFERKVISQLAQVHGGTAPDGSKDTIGAMGWEDESSIQDGQYRPKIIAALVRFADEICETSSRAANFLLRHGLIPEKSLIYQAYANSILFCNVDLKDKAVRIGYSVTSENAIKNFGTKPGNDQYLIDIILQRLQKMNNERIYCNRYMAEVVPIKRIRFQILIEHELETLKSVDGVIEESGYPDESYSFPKQFFNEHPDWRAEALCTELKP